MAVEVSVDCATPDSSERRNSAPKSAVAAAAAGDDADADADDAVQVGDDVDGGCSLECALAGGCGAARSSADDAFAAAL